jgi:sigma-B regulation protein RsbU (phosphoserine phosphatase)
MRTGSSRILRSLVCIYLAASLTYFIATAAAVYEEHFHQERHVHDPFEMDSDSLALTKIYKEAEEAGLAKGDIIESLDGEKYRGQAQWRRIDQTAHPGDTLRVGVRDARGRHRVANIHFIQAAQHTWSAMEKMVVCVLVGGTLVCLLLGYWVAFARPREPNAWLILLLLSFPEVAYGSRDWWPGSLQAFLEFWYQTMQVLGPVVVLLIGIYFPERWRLDRKWPWLKWILIIPQAIGYLLIMISEYARYYHPTLGAFSKSMGPIVDHVMNPVSLICVILYFAAIFDKLHSASTADARRRMRVLCAGSTVGLGSLLIIFVFIAAFGIKLPKSFESWVVGIGAVLVFLFPLSLAYVVVVQRALDVRILLRMGTKYLLARATLAFFQIVLAAIVVWKLIQPLLMKKALQLHDLIIPLVIAGLFIALTYFGLGRRLQQWLDRKFFREAYTSELVLHELSEQARTLTESDSLLSTVCRRISEVLHVPQIGVLLRGGQVFRLRQAVGFDLAIPVALSEKSYTVQNLTRENRPATLYREDPDSWFSRAGGDEQRALNSVNAEILLPLPGREKLMGVMTLGPKLSEEPYSPSDLRLLQSVATQTGLALEVSELAHSLAHEAAQRERINREIEIAREVQERLFPQKIPQIPGIELAGACRPAQGVGGDYYDFIELEDGRIGLAIGDVSGKGISAALLMASLRASLRGMMLEDPRNLSRLMSNVNRLVYESSTISRYATFFFAIFNPSDRELKYVNAGHNPPVLLCQGNGTQRLEAGGPVIGLLRDLTYEEQSVILESGNLLLAYTDGISEAMTLAHEEWGEERMIEAARAARNLEADCIVRKIFEAADTFTNEAPQHDDMTLLVMKVENA